jgi:hypothetical protein
MGWVDFWDLSFCEYFRAGSVNHKPCVGRARLCWHTWEEGGRGRGWQYLPWECYCWALLFSHSHKRKLSSIILSESEILKLLDARYKCREILVLPNLPAQFSFSLGPATAVLNRDKRRRTGEYR